MKRNPLRKWLDRSDSPALRPEPLRERELDVLRVETAAFGLLPGSSVDVFRGDTHVLALFDYRYMVEVVVTDPEIGGSVAGRSSFRIPAPEYYAEYAEAVRSGSPFEQAMPTADEFEPLLEHLQAVRTGEEYRIVTERGVQ